MIKCGPIFFSKSSDEDVINLPPYPGNPGISGTDVLTKIKRQIRGAMSQRNLALDSTEQPPRRSQPGSSSLGFVLHGERKQSRLDNMPGSSGLAPLQEEESGPTSSGVRLAVSGQAGSASSKAATIDAAGRRSEHSGSLSFGTPSQPQVPPLNQVKDLWGMSH